MPEPGAASGPACDPTHCWAGPSVIDPGRTTRRSQACSVRSSALGETMAGRAGSARGWLAVEHTGAWGRDAVEDVLGETLRGVALSGIRVVLIRRSAGRAPHTGPRTVFLAWSAGDAPWIRQTTIDDLDELPDLTRLIGAREPAEGCAPALPTVLVCTHGKRDACCAEFGRPVYRAVRDHPAADVWESSHVGGDRFAANLVLLPEGLHYSRLTPDTAHAPIDAYLDGRIDLPRFRGRSARSMPEQAAEHAVRVATGISELWAGAVRVQEQGTTGRASTVTVRAGSDAFRVVLEEDAVQRDGVAHACDSGDPPAMWSTWRAVRLARVDFS